MEAKRKPSRVEKLDHLYEAFRHVTNWRHAVDVGAHGGLWSEQMAGHFARVTAFEPLPANCERWRARMAPHSHTELHEIALADRIARAVLKGEGHSKHFIEFAKRGPIGVAPLDSFRFDDIGLLKIDVEGADSLVIAGAADTIKRCKPVIIIENMGSFQARFGLAENAVPEKMRQIGARQVAEMWRDMIWVFED